MSEATLPIDEVICADAIEGLATLPADCGTLAIVDGPYNMRKAAWDKFASWDEFREFYRPLWAALGEALRDNCSLYVFGTFESLAALKPDLDGLGGGWRFVNHIVLHREAVYLKKFAPEKFRSWLPGHYEDCLFYARERVDISALAWDGVTRDDNSIRAYLNTERERAGLSVADIHKAWYEKYQTYGCGAGHWFGQSQWRFPPRRDYLWLRDLFNERGPVNDEYLRREYEDLRREYEDLRYTFNPEKGVTDVWNVPICAGAERVKANGETAHVAQKPLEIMRRIVRASSNEGDLVLVPFSGVGSAEVACKELGRRFIGFDISEEYCAMARRRIGNAQGAMAL